MKAKVIILPAAAKYFKKIADKALKNKFLNVIEQLSENPYFGEAKKGDLKGIYSCDIYYNKTNYEMAYRVSINEEGTIVVIIMAGTRENFYKELKRHEK